MIRLFIVIVIKVVLARIRWPLIPPGKISPEQFVDKVSFAKTFPNHGNRIGYMFDDLAGKDDVR